MVFLMWNMGSLVQSTIVKTGSQLLGTPVTLDSVRINPFKGTGELRMLAVANPTNYSEGPAVEIQEIAAEIQPTSLMGEKIRYLPWPSHGSKWRMSGTSNRATWSP